MSIRPLDLTLTIQRTPEVNRNQTNEGIRQEVLGQQTADTIKREVQTQDQTVMQANKTEENTVNRDGRGNSGYGGSGGGKGKKGKKEESAKPVKYGGSLDVSI